MGKSGRGGTRAGGGRPSNWNHTPTCTIRVPEIFAEALLEIARDLDKGQQELLVVNPKSLEVQRQTKQEYLSMTALRIYKSSGHKVIRVEELIEILKTLTSTQE